MKRERGIFFMFIVVFSLTVFGLWIGVFASFVQLLEYIPITDSRKLFAIGFVSFVFLVRSVFVLKKIISPNKTIIFYIQIFILSALFVAIVFHDCALNIKTYSSLHIP